MLQAKYAIIIIISVIILSGCGREDKTQSGKTPGSEKSGKTKTLETGAATLQNFDPMKAVSMYLDGFHFVNGDLKNQMEAHHYCTKLNEDVTQCVIYDGNTKEARLIGLEYIISEKLFKTLPEEEKHLWHSHNYEVKSGTLIAPGLPDAATHELMEEIVSTYGKTWHTWHSEKDKLPMGIPHLMMGFTKDGQLNPDLLSSRDKRFEISSSEQKENRKDIAEPPVQPGANAWEKGIIMQIDKKDLNKK